MSRRSLRKSIGFLVKEITKSYKEAILDGSVKYRFLPYERATLHITRKKFVHSCEIERAITVRAEFLRKDQRRFMKNNIESLPSSSETLQLAETVVKNPKWAPSVVLRGLVHQVAKEMVSVLNKAYVEFEASVNERSKEIKSRDGFVDLQTELQSAITMNVESHKSHNTSYVNRALTDLYGETKIWDVKMWLTGTYVNTETITGEDYELRVPTKADLTFEFPVGHPPSWLGSGNLAIPTSILQIKVKAKDQPTLTREISRLMNSLLLLHGGIDYWRYSSTCDSIVENRDEICNTTVRETSGVVFGLPNKDEIDFHMRELPNLIPDEIMKGIFHQETGLAIAYQKYVEVMRTQHTPWDQVNSCIIGLEAIFLEQGYEPGKGIRLAKRAAPVLSSENLSKTSIRKNITKGYSGIRNKIVHGTPLSKEDKQLSMKILGLIVECLRRSIILLIQEKKQDFHF